MMRWFVDYIIKKFKLRVRLLLLFVVPVLISYIASVSLSFVHLNNLTEARLEQLRASAEAALKQSSVRSLIRGDIRDIKETAKSLVESTEINSVKVLDGDNKLFIESGTANPSFPHYITNIYYQPYISDSDDLATDKPRIIGTLHYQVDIDSLSSASLQVIYGEGWIIAISCIILIPLVIALYKSNTIPLSRIRLEINQLKNGHPIAKPGDESLDEFGQISSALYQASITITNQTNKIKEKNDQLQQKAIELEHQVKIATEAREAADRANTLKDRFVSNISHELKTPLSGILSGIDLSQSAFATLTMTIFELTSDLELSADQYKKISDIKKELKNIEATHNITYRSSILMRGIVDDLLSLVQDVYYDINCTDSYLI